MIDDIQARGLVDEEKLEELTIALYRQEYWEKDILCEDEAKKLREMGNTDLEIYKIMGGTIDIQGVSQSERREISDERDKRETARTLKGENVEENFTLDENTLPLWLKQDLKKFLDCKNSNVHPNFDLSLYWSELYTTINISQLSKEITKDEADYLRRKYLGIC